MLAHLKSRCRTKKKPMQNFTAEKWADKIALFIDNFGFLTRFFLTLDYCSTQSRICNSCDVFLPISKIHLCVPFCQSFSVFWRLSGWTIWQVHFKQNENKQAWWDIIIDFFAMLKGLKNSFGRQSLFWPPNLFFLSRRDYKVLFSLHFQQGSEQSW